MKITKSYLKQIIKEELNHMEEGAFANEISGLGFTAGQPDYPKQIAVMVGYISGAVRNLENALGSTNPKSAETEIRFALEKLQEIIKEMSQNRE